MRQLDHPQIHLPPSVQVDTDFQGEYLTALGVGTILRRPVLHTVGDKRWDGFLAVVVSTVPLWYRAEQGML